MKDIIQVNHENLQVMIENSYTKKTPLFVHGTFGIGKSSAVKAYGKECSARLGLKYSEDPSDINKEDTFLVLVIPLHQYDVSELKGIPVPSEDRKSTVFLPTGQLPAVGRGILFFDELNLAPPLVQANAYQLILDRRLGAYRLPEGFVAMAAGNTADDMAHNFEMAMPLKNRFRHCMLTVPSVPEWVRDYAIPNNIDHRVITFLSFRSDLLYKFNPEKDVDMTAVPTPRMWETAARSIDGVESMDLVGMFVGSSVGAAIGAEFVAYMELSMKYDIAGIFESGTLPDDPKKMEMSLVYALMSAIVGHYKSGMKSDKEHKNVGKILKFFHSFRVEHGITLLVLMKAVDKEFFNKARAKFSKEFKEIADKHTKFML
jgi:hypothetical protein